MAFRPYRLSGQAPLFGFAGIKSGVALERVVKYNINKVLLSLFHENRIVSIRLLNDSW